MNKILLFLSAGLLLIPALCKTQGHLCDSSYLFCQTTSYPGNVSGESAEPGAYYGCLTTQPNPTWFHLKIRDSGSVAITIKTVPVSDIDFACWGPFTSPTTPCVEELTEQKMIDCSYSPYPTEICMIPDGKTGEYYILLATKYTNQECNINLSQTVGLGTLDCFATSVDMLKQRNKPVSLINFPNPFNNKTTFVFSIRQNSKVKLDIYDVTGKFVQTLFDDEAIKDKDYTVDYYCKDNNAGIYIYKLTTDNTVVTGKIMHIRN
jgi:hypothetical protein